MPLLRVTPVGRTCYTILISPEILNLKHFQVLTAIALTLFADQNVDFAVVEVSACSLVFVIS